MARTLRATRCPSPMNPPLPAVLPDEATLDTGRSLPPVVADEDSAPALVGDMVAAFWFPVYVSGGGPLSPPPPPPQPAIKARTASAALDRKVFPFGFICRLLLLSRI